jgi:hypothetical protein
MNYFGKRTIGPQSHSVEDRHLQGAEVITTHVAPIEVCADHGLLNVNGDGDQMLYDRGVFMMTDHLDIRMVTHILDVDDVLHSVSARSSVKKVGRETRLIALDKQKTQTLLLEIVINDSTGLVISSGNDRIKGFVLGGSRGFNSNIPSLNIMDLPLGKQKTGRKPKAVS